MYAATRSGTGLPMPIAPTPEEIYQRAKTEGHRRLFMPPLEQVATSFIAGVTIVFGIVALGVVEALIEPDLGSGTARVAGALAFGTGVVFLVVGRTELFSENFFHPVATAIEGSRLWGRLGRLWVTTLALNLVGGAVLVAVLTVQGALPGDSAQVLARIAEDITAKAWPATLARAVLAGGLITLLSYMLSAVNSVAARILVAYMVGVFLALGPFDHVVVSALHVLLGLWLDGAVTYVDLATNVALATVGNLVGGLLLITLTHTAQVKGD